MDILLIKGILIGLMTATPVGPSALLSIKKNLSKGGKSGLLFGYGVATADLIYSLLAAFCILVFSDFTAKHKMLLSLIGSAALISIGIRELVVKQFYRKKIKISYNDGNRDYLSGFVIAIINPAMILLFFSVYTLIGMPGENHTTKPLIIIAGSFIGTMIGWSLLNLAISKLKPKIHNNIINNLNLLAGSLIILCGGFLFIKSLICI